MYTIETEPKSLCIQKKPRLSVYVDNENRARCKQKKPSTSVYADNRNQARKFMYTIGTEP